MPRAQSWKYFMEFLTGYETNHDLHKKTRPSEGRCLNIVIFNACRIPCKIKWYDPWHADQKNLCLHFPLQSSAVIVKGSRSGEADQGTPKDIW